jgi:glycosyltransferase involved in cell wall biosynthesis
VEIRKPTDDPATLFRDCRVMLVPSQWPEAWGRVVSEAQISGIPTLASDVGGLPESVGPGGILVHPKDSKEAWLAGLTAIWDDADRYERLSELALAHSQRPDIAVDRVVQRFEELLRQAIVAHARCR